jgi:hypothetical protein
MDSNLNILFQDKLVDIYLDRGVDKQNQTVVLLSEIRNKKIGLYIMEQIIYCSLLHLT